MEAGADRACRRGRRLTHSATWLIVFALTFSLAGCGLGRVWTIATFESAEGRFSVVVPEGTMVEGTLVGGGPFAGATIRTFVHDVPGGPRFAVLYGDAAPDYLEGISVDAALDAVETANIEATGGEQIDGEHLAVAGLPGREQRITVPGAIYVFRTVFAGNRLYSISVKGTDTQVTQADVVVYFDSFKISR
jgi:hypothetical protein